MMNMMRSTTMTAVVAVAVLLGSSDAARVRLTNRCGPGVLFAAHRGKWDFPNGGTVEHYLAPGATAFRYGTGPMATLAEFSPDGGRVWFDISIIPTSISKGPGFCESLGHCKAVTGGVGFNVPMQIIPSKPDGNRCRPLTCMYDGCPEAYQFPKDDTKTHNCPPDTSFDVIFCPGGPAPPPGPPPAPAPAPTTPTPTTPTPTTPAPTTPAPTTARVHILPIYESGDLYTAATSSDASSDSSSENELSIGEERDAKEENGVIQPAVEEETVAPSTPAPTMPIGESVQEANTQSSGGNVTSVSLIVVGVLGAVAMIAGAAIYTIRKKKAELEAMEQKSPGPLSVNDRSRSMMMTTPRDMINVL